jgi:hypothetical protein
MKATKMDICSHRHTVAFCLLSPWRESLLAPVESEDLTIATLALRENGSLLVQDNAHEGRVDVQTAVVVPNENPLF